MIDQQRGKRVASAFITSKDEIEAGEQTGTVALNVGHRTYRSLTGRLVKW